VVVSRKKRFPRKKLFVVWVGRSASFGLLSSTLRTRGWPLRPARRRQLALATPSASVDKAVGDDDDDESDVED
jgi:hypothetical protein